MNRLVFALLLATPALNALAATDACKVTGTVYDAGGRPLRAAVVRLVDLDARQIAFSAADAHAMFAFDGVPTSTGGYRLDVLSTPATVTGSHIATRSVLGRSPTFACGAGQPAHQDVHVQID